MFKRLLFSLALLCCTWGSAFAQNANQVPSLATFRANAYGGTVWLAGYVTPGDGGQGYFLPNGKQSVTHCVDNGTTVIVDKNGTCWDRQSWGGVPIGTPSMVTVPTITALENIGTSAGASVTAAYVPGIGIYQWNATSTATPDPSDTPQTIVQVTGVTTGRMVLQNGAVGNVANIAALEALPDAPIGMTVNVGGTQGGSFTVVAGTLSASDGGTTFFVSNSAGGAYADRYWQRNLLSATNIQEQYFGCLNNGSNDQTCWNNIIAYARAHPDTTVHAPGGENSTLDGTTFSSGTTLIQGCLILSAESLPPPEGLEIVGDGSPGTQKIFTIQCDDNGTSYPAAPRDYIGTGSYTYGLFSTASTTYYDGSTCASYPEECGINGLTLKNIAITAPEYGIGAFLGQYRTVSLENSQIYSNGAAAASNLARYGVVSYDGLSLKIDPRSIIGPPGFSRFGVFLDSYAAIDSDTNHYNDNIFLCPQWAGPWWAAVGDNGSGTEGSLQLCGIQSGSAYYFYLGVNRPTLTIGGSGNPAPYTENTDEAIYIPPVNSTGNVPIPGGAITGLDAAFPFTDVFPAGLPSFNCNIDSFDMAFGTTFADLSGCYNATVKSVVLQDGTQTTYVKDTIQYPYGGKIITPPAWDTSSPFPDTSTLVFSPQNTLALQGSLSGTWQDADNAYVSCRPLSWVLSTTNDGQAVNCTDTRQVTLSSTTYPVISIPYAFAGEVIEKCTAASSAGGYPAVSETGHFFTSTDANGVLELLGTATQDSIINVNGGTYNAPTTPYLGYQIVPNSSGAKPFIYAECHIPLIGADSGATFSVTLIGTINNNAAVTNLDGNGDYNPKRTTDSVTVGGTFTTF